jgi:hypothetical protein
MTKVQKTDVIKRVFTVVRDSQKGDQVHKQGCRDTEKYSWYYGKWDIEVSCWKELVDDTFDCFYEEDGLDWQAYMSEFRLMPCAGSLPMEVK